MWTMNFQMFKLDLEKAEEPKIKMPTSSGSSKKQEFQKNTYFCFINYTKVFVYITTNSGKFFKRWEYQTSWPASWETSMQVKKQQLELDMEQQTGSKWQLQSELWGRCGKAFGSWITIRIWIEGAHKDSAHKAVSLLFFFFWKWGPKY